MHADLDALLTAIYVLVDDFLPERRGPGAPPRISDAELVTVAIAQVLLGLPNDRQFLALARYRLGHLFPYLPKQPGYNKRLRSLAPQIGRCINYLAYISPSFGDGLRLLDSTPVPCGQSRETARRSQFCGYASYGYCRSHSRYFWGFRLYLPRKPHATQGLSRVVVGACCRARLRLAGGGPPLPKQKSTTPRSRGKRSSLEPFGGLIAQRPSR